MNVLIINYILYTPDGNGRIPKVKSIKDTMIYGMCHGFIEAGHSVTLAAGAEYKPEEGEIHEFDVRFFNSKSSKITPPNYFHTRLIYNNLSKQTKTITT